MNKLMFLTLVALLSFGVGAQEIVTKSENPFEFGGQEVFTVHSKVLGRKYDIYVQLPSGYLNSENESTSYPVLYLNDGPHTFKVAAGVTHFKSMNKAVVVGISFAHGEDGQFSRVRDLTPEVDRSWVNYTTGGASDYLRFIEEEVMPFVEINYRVNPTQRILAGHSLGGLFGAWVLLTKPELFSSYILTSPSLWFKDNSMFKLEERFAKSHNSLKVNVFFATGALEVPEKGMNNDLVDGHRKFVAQLRSRNYQGLQIKDEVVSGTDHYSTFPVGLAKGLRWLYQDW